MRNAKVIDFGIARSLKRTEATIIGGGFAGKYNYASPEQFGLAGGEVTFKSDIYSFGLVLAAALRGRPIDMSGSEVEAIAKRSVSSGSVRHRSSDPAAHSGDAATSASGPSSEHGGRCSLGVRGGDLDRGAEGGHATDGRRPRRRDPRSIDCARQRRWGDLCLPRRAGSLGARPDTPTAPSAPAKLPPIAAPPPAAQIPPLAPPTAQIPPLTPPAAEGRPQPWRRRHRG